mgnify:FL=1
MKRVYPYGNLASQVLGVVNVDNDGLTGLEKQYNKLLTGTNGSLVRERARDGSYIAGGAYKKVAAVDGVDIVTTLDVNIQRAAEDAWQRQLRRLRPRTARRWSPILRQARSWQPARIRLTTRPIWKTPRPRI